MSCADLIGHLDHLFKDGRGMKELMRVLYEEEKGQRITTPFFQSFLERETGMDLKDLFHKYVFGKSDSWDPDALSQNLLPPIQNVEALIRQLPAHYRPYTEEELKALQ